MKRMFNKPGSSSKKESKEPPADTTAAMSEKAKESPNKTPADDETLPRSGDPSKKTLTKSKSRSKSLEEQLATAKEQIAQEKAGKRKLFHSLVKLANELRRTRNESVPLVEQKRYQERSWYEGGMWRAPQVLPALGGDLMSSGSRTKATGTEAEGATGADAPSATNTSAQAEPGVDALSRRATRPALAHRTTRIRGAISLSDLFFNLVIVTAFTRVGVAISESGQIDFSSFCYFFIFWSVWNKETSYSTRFDTTDLSAQMTTLFTCFAALFACLSVQSPINSIDANRVMIMAGSVALLHCALHARVLATTMPGASSRLAKHVANYAIYNIIVCALEGVVWFAGVFLRPVDWEYRYVIYVVALLLSLRIPRAFLANDFHAACSKRGVLFILLLGFLLQSIVVVATEFFEYQTPTPEHYSFIGSVCLMFFCIKLLYVDDSDTLAEDHALLVNRTAGFFFNVGQFALLLSTTIMGSGLNLLTHSYLAATAALPGPEKTLVCGGFSATLFSTFFIKSMHLKRVPTDPRNQALFISAYVVQSVVLLVVVGISAAMCLGSDIPFLSNLMQTDVQLLFVLSGLAFFLVLMSWLDEGVELALYESSEHSRAYRVQPFGFWWCLKPDVSDEEISHEMEDSYAQEVGSTRQSLSVLSPLLGSSVASSMRDLGEYGSLTAKGSSTSLGDV